jgi:hypothetical protein
MPDFDPYFEWLGILSSQQPADYYRLLGVAQFEANTAAIAASADQRMALVACHQGGPRDAEARRLLAELADAREWLVDPQRKSAYDELLRTHGGRPVYVAPRHAVVAGPPPPPPRAGAAQLPVARRLEEDQQRPEQPTDEPAEDETAPSNRRVWLVASGIAVITLVLGGVTAGVIVVLGRRDDGSAIETSDEPSPKPPPVVEPPELEAPIVEPSGNELVFTSKLASETNGPDLKLTSVISGWSPGSSVSWECRVEQRGYYRLQISYAADEGGGEYTISAEDAASPIKGTVRSAGTGGNIISEGSSKNLVFLKTGLKTLTMQADKVPGKDLMQLESIRLTYSGLRPSVQ